MVTRSDVKFGVRGVVMDKAPARRHFTAHKELRDLGGVHRVLDLDQFQIAFLGITL